MRNILLLCLALVSSTLNAAAPEPDWTSTDRLYQGTEFRRYKTDPASWSAEGGFGLQWGMGPGDVQAIYPDLSSVFADDAVPDAYQQGLIQDEIEGAPVNVMVLFQRGRLINVMIGKESVEPPIDAKALAAAHRDHRAWRGKVLALLTAKYGRPSTVPDPKVLEQDRRNQPAKGSYEWLTQRTGVQLYLSTKLVLRYRDLAPAAEYTAARSKAKAEDEKLREEQALKARDRL